MRIIFLLAVGCLACAGAALDPATSLLAAWPNPDASVVALLKDVGASAVFTPLDGKGESRAVVRVCRSAGLTAIAQLPVTAGTPELKEAAARAHAAGFAGVAYHALSGERATREFAASPRGLVQFVYLKPDQIHWDVSPAYAVLDEGVWPGVQPLDPTVASASEAPWVDANLFLVAYLRGMFPRRPALLAYAPDEKAGVPKERLLPFDSLELALVDARAAGGNVILTPPLRLREALLQRNGKALAAWNSLGSMLRFLNENAAVLAEPASSRVTVAAGSLENSGEMLNLLFRRNASPAVVPRSGLAGGFLPNTRLLVATGLAGAPVAQKAALEFARLGGHLFTAPDSGNEDKWWIAALNGKARSDDEREFYPLGKGAVVAYREPIVDPAEFALDVIDTLGWSARDLRLWSTDSAIALLRRPSRDQAAIAVVNYGSPVEDGFMIRLEGVFPTAILTAPESPRPIALRTAVRGPGTEIEPPGMNRCAIILVSKRNQ